MKLKSIPVEEAEKLVLDTGLLFLINRLILHRVGLALAFSGEEGEKMTNIQIMRLDTDGVGGDISAEDKQIHFSPDTELAAVEKLLAFIDKNGGDIDPLLYEAIDLVLSIK